MEGMDIGFKTSDGIFSLRAAALIIRENRLLLVKNEKLDRFYTVGGKIKVNETAENAVLRECYEETGCHLEIERLLFVQERFFQAAEIKHHEVVFFYLMKDANVELPEGINTDRQGEYLYWIPIDELESINLLPIFLKTALKNIPDGIGHIVEREE